MSIIRIVFTFASLMMSICMGCEIFVSTPKDIKLSIEVGPAETIGELRQKVADQSGTEEGIVSLSFAGRELDSLADSTTLADISMRKEAVVDFTRKEIPLITIRFHYAGSPIWKLDLKPKVTKKGSGMKFDELTNHIGQAIRKGEKQMRNYNRVVIPSERQSLNDAVNASVREVVEKGEGWILPEGTEFLATEWIRKMLTGFVLEYQVSVTYDVDRQPWRPLLQRVSTDEI